MITNFRSILLASLLSTGLSALVGCANEGGKTSLTRTAAKLRPGDVQVLTSQSAAATGSADQVKNAEQSSTEIIRTSAPDWQTSYNLSHEVLGRSDLKEDVARWGMRALLKDSSGKIIDTFQQRGLQGTALLKFGELEGNFTIELSAHEFSKDGPQDQLGSSKIIKIFRDTKAPVVSLDVSSAEDLERKIMSFEAKVSARDEDTLAPICKRIEFLSASDEVTHELVFAPTGNEWKRLEGSASWNQSAKLDANLLGSLPVSARIECKDRTGNATTTVLSLPRASRTELQPQIQLSPAGRSMSAVPRFASEGDSRLFLLENRQIKFNFALKTGSIAISEPEVFDKKRNELTFVIQAKLASDLESTEARQVWSGVPESEKTIELPGFLIGAVDLKLTVIDSLASSGEAATLLSTTHKLYISPTVNSAVVPRLELLAPGSFFPAIKDASVTLSARAVSSGLRFGSDNFPILEMTEDGNNWSQVEGVAYTLARKEAAATGQETWNISFPYPFSNERALRFRIRGRIADNLELVSNVSKRVIGAPDLADQIPAVDAAQRQACAGKSNLKVSFASRIACTTKDGNNARLYVAFENQGTAPFVLSSSSGVKVNLGYVAYQGTSQAFAGIVPGDETSLNLKGLNGRQLIAIDLPKTYLTNVTDFTLQFDRQSTGAHSLQNGTYCYSAQEFPTLNLRQNAKLEVTLSPLICDDEL